MVYEELSTNFLYRVTLNIKGFVSIVDRFLGRRVIDFMNARADYQIYTRSQHLRTGFSTSMDAFSLLLHTRAMSRAVLSETLTEQHQSFVQTLAHEVFILQRTCGPPARDSISMELCIKLTRAHTHRLDTILRMISIFRFPLFLLLHIDYYELMNLVL